MSLDKRLDEIQAFHECGEYPFEPGVRVYAGGWEKLAAKRYEHIGHLLKVIEQYQNTVVMLDKQRAAYRETLISEGYNIDMKAAETADA